MRNTFRLTCLALLAVLVGTGCRRSMENDCSGVLPFSVEVSCQWTAPGLAGEKRAALELVMQDILLEDMNPANEVKIPEEKWLPYARALKAVRTAIPAISCEDMASLTEIEPTAWVSMERLLVQVDTNVAWIQAWRDGSTLTNNPEIDHLINAYHLTLVHYYFWSSGEYAVLGSAEPLNLRRLGAEMTGIDGVIEAFAETRIGDGDNVDAWWEGDDVVIEISRGYGDCPSGCIHRDIWKFRVTPACRVIYEGFRAT